MSDRRIVTRKAGERRRGRTDFARLAARTDEEIEAAARSDPDNPPATAEWLARAKRVERPSKEAISIRIDSDVLAWFRAQGNGYQSMMNAVLRSYADHSRMAAAVASSLSNVPKPPVRAAERSKAASTKPRRRKAG